MKIIPKERWNNWIARTKESGFSLSDSDDAPDTTIFVKMERRMRY